MFSIHPIDSIVQGVNSLVSEKYTNPIRDMANRKIITAGKYIILSVAKDFKNLFQDKAIKNIFKKSR